MTTQNITQDTSQQDRNNDDDVFTIQQTIASQYYQLSLTLVVCTECNVRGCSHFHSDTYSYKSELPRDFVVDDIDENGNYLKDWRQLDVACGLTHMNVVRATCVLLPKVNLKRDLLDIMKLHVGT